MNTTISIICYKSKTLSNGEHPLMLRITQNRKIKYKSLNISISEKHWDFKKNIPKSNCPNKDLILKIILKAKLEYQQKVLEKKANDEEFTATSLINETNDEIKAKTVEEFYQLTINELREKGQIGNSYAYLNSYNTLKNFNKGKKLDYTFSHIDVAFCKKLEDWLRSKGNKDTTLSYQFRTLRATFNKAIEAKIVSREKNPFIEYKLSRFNTKTIKRALSKEDILKIINTDCSGKSELRQLTHDLFSFSYLCGGISFVDIANLTCKNIVEGRLIYQRQKTHGNINLILSDKALEIIQKYNYYCLQTSFLFPILHNKRHITPMQKNNRIHKICHQVNQELRLFAKELNINAEVTTYVARHSFATILKKSGVNIGIISEALGHQDIKTTQIYLSHFDNEQIDAAMQNLL
ncbi:site-specific integrase [Bacteroides sp. BFG-257]|uniref:site-specific integrase n=1 Tax=Bacteroides TaxID=816 RepID=UPI001CCEB17E|nr:MULTISPECIES: site-specific integrase [Bacteroides]UBD71783.1 site-specific integrase [Bacteroides cellulosilyticus]UVP00400.1 site-specific integrase [Bacteroides sp. BFG-257]